MRLWDDRDKRLERDREREWRRDRAFSVNGIDDTDSLFTRCRLSLDANCPHSDGLPYGSCPCALNTLPSARLNSVKVSTG